MTNKKEQLITKTESAQLLGLTMHMFNKLNIEPYECIQNYNYRKSFIYLYKETEIKKLINSEEVQRLKLKTPKPKDWTSKFNKRYDKKSPLPEVAKGLFNLNRYSKHNSCSRENREEIYEMKNGIIHYLYKNGYCFECYEHNIHGVPAICNSCGGSGIYQKKWECYSCFGTGRIHDVKIDLYYVVFRFNIEGTIYTWHQPEHTIHFIYKTTKPESIYEESEIKPIEVSKSKLSEYKALLRWFLNTHLTSH